MKNLRRAALQLRELDARDRDWLLQNLAPEERERVEPLLQELESMAVPGGNGLLQALRGVGDEGDGTPVPSPPTGPRTSTPTEWKRRLHGADLRALLALLADQPDPVLAPLLACEPWAWRDRFLGALPRPRRRALEGYTNGHLSPALREALVEVVAQELANGRGGATGGNDAKADGRHSAATPFESILAGEEAKPGRRLRRRRRAWRR